MNDDDSKLIWEAYDQPDNIMEEADDGKDKLIEQLKRLNDLIPKDAVVQWSISDGSFSSLTPDSVLGDAEENKSIKALIGVLMKVWSDPEYANELGLANTDWSGKDSYSGSIFWTANDTHYHDIHGKGYTDELQRIKPEHKERYDQFFSDKRKADNYVSKLVGRLPQLTIPDPEARDPGEITPETFKDQKHWRISLSPKSEEITKKGDATYDAVGYGKGRYMGD